MYFIIITFWTRRIHSIKTAVFNSQGGEEPNTSAAAAAGWSLSGISSCRPGEGQKEKGGTGAAEAGRGESPADGSSRGTQTTSESHFLLNLFNYTTRQSSFVKYKWVHILRISQRVWAFLKYFVWEGCFFRQSPPQIAVILQSVWMDWCWTGTACDKAKIVFMGKTWSSVGMTKPPVWTHIKVDTVWLTCRKKWGRSSK